MVVVLSEGLIDVLQNLVNSLPPQTTDPNLLLEAFEQSQYSDYDPKDFPVLDTVLDVMEQQPPIEELKGPPTLQEKLDYFLAVNNYGAERQFTAAEVQEESLDRYTEHRKYLQNEFLRKALTKWFERTYILAMERKKQLEYFETSLLHRTCAVWLDRTRTNRNRRFDAQTRRNNLICYEALDRWRIIYQKRLYVSNFQAKRNRDLARQALMQWRYIATFRKKQNKVARSKRKEKDALILKEFLGLWFNLTKRNRFSSAKDLNLAYAAVQQWKDASYRLFQLTELANDFQVGSNRNLLKRHLDVWRYRLSRRQEDLQLFMEISDSRLALSALDVWRRRHNHLVELSDKAYQQHGMSIQKSHFVAWRKKYHFRKINRYFFEKEVQTMSKYLNVWIDFTRKVVDLRAKAGAVKEMVDFDIKSRNLQVWLQKFMSIKSKELEAERRRKRKLLSFCANMWIDQSKSIQNKQKLAQYHLEAKRKDISKRYLRKWYNLKHYRVQKRNRLQLNLKDWDQHIIQKAFSHWYDRVRFKALATKISGYNDNIRGPKLLQHSFQTWVSQVPKINAIQHYKATLLRRSFKMWRRNYILNKRYLEMVNFLRPKLLPKFWDLWKAKYNKKVSFKASEKFRLMSAASSIKANSATTLSSSSQHQNSNVNNKSTATPSQIPRTPRLIPRLLKYHPNDTSSSSNNSDHSDKEGDRDVNEDDVEKDKGLDLHHGSRFTRPISSTAAAASTKSTATNNSNNSRKLNSFFSRLNRPSRNLSSTSSLPNLNNSNNNVDTPHRRNNFFFNSAFRASLSAQEDNGDYDNDDNDDDLPRQRPATTTPTPRFRQLQQHKKTISFGSTSGGVASKRNSLLSRHSNPSSHSSSSSSTTSSIFKSNSRVNFQTRS